MKSQSTSLSESSQSGKATDRMVPALGRSGKGTTLETVKGHYCQGVRGARHEHRGSGGRAATLLI